MAKRGSGSFLEDLAREPRKPRNVCALSDFLSRQPPKEAADIKAAILSGTEPVSVIHKVLKRRGYARASETLRRHRRGDCTLCERSKGDA